MKFLLIGNPCFCAALKALGHDVILASRPSAYPANTSIDIPITITPTQVETINAALPNGWHPDWVFLCDDSTFPIVIGLESLPYPLAWYAIDSHIQGSWHSWYATVFDYIFVAHKDYLINYRINERGAMVKWLPVFCDPAKDRYLDREKIHDISFVGTMNPDLNPKRVEFIEAVKKRIPINVAQGEYVEIFNQSKMVLNQCVQNDLNLRVFEVMACGSLLLTEDSNNGLKDLFVDKKHLALYHQNDVDSVVKQFDHYMENEDKLKAISQCGMDEVHNKHTVNRRIKMVVDLLGKEPAQKLLEKRHKQLPFIKQNVAKVMNYVAMVYFYQSETTNDLNRAKRLLLVCQNYVKIIKSLS
ncbi:MAG: glycosyltransferase family 1 protein [Magnetococcales bacterium]|nr:glycosyltransferase family 1 protein [Magnetococcales bacterium]